MPLLTPELQAREQIDRMLAAAGWQVQTRQQMNLAAATGVAVCEFQMTTGAVDYLLFADGRPIGVVEAKKAGTSLSGVEPQAKRYTGGLPAVLEPKAWYNPLPFRYETTGVETFFADDRDPDARSRRVFSFHRPETLVAWAQEDSTLRARLRQLPPLVPGDLWSAQIKAIQGLEQSLAEDRPRALIQMATGSGKTFTAVNFVYRLIKHAKAQRVLFMVDRSNLGRQAYNEYMQFTTPDDGRKFGELYNVQHMQSNVLDPVSKVCITTVQRLYSMLRGELELDPELEERPLASLAHLFEEQPKEVVYNPAFPLEYFDFIVIDECHRSIYNLWRQVLEYFDAYLIGLTATPALHTYGFFNQNLVMEYTDRDAVIDGVNVDSWVYRIRTRITESGSTVEAGEWVGKRDKKTRDQRWEQLDEELEYEGRQLDREVQTPDQIRLIVCTFRDKLFTEIFPGRDEVPKTLIFAKDDNHAEEIVRIVREEFAKGDDFCQKITYKASGKPEDLINDLRNSYYPRIAVTVDMVATGTDVKPLEVLIFMRQINSANYFRQMRGRGTRVISETDLRSVSPSAARKTHFVLVDAVGVVEHPKIDSAPLDRKRSLPFDKLLERLAWGVYDEDDFDSLAVRLSRLEKELTEHEQTQIENLTGGKSPRELAAELLASVDPDAVQLKAQELAAEAGLDPAAPLSEDQLAAAQQALMAGAAAPFNQPELREAFSTITKRTTLTIDITSQDDLLEAAYSASDTERARELVGSFQDFLEENRDRIAALQLLYSRPYRARELTLQQIEELNQRIEQPPHAWTTQALWQAYAQLERDKVRGVRTERVLTDLVSLVRHALQMDDELLPYPERVQARYQDWLAAQQAEGRRRFSPEQRWWLDRIAQTIGLNLGITPQDFQHGELHGRGGWIAARKLFGADLPALLSDMNETLST